MSTIVLYSDGAARGNPGPASIGAVLYRDGDRTPCAEISETIGETTNNVAEYRAVIAGLESAVDFEPELLIVRADSLLLIRQLQGIFRVKAPGLKPLHRRAVELLGRFDHVRLEHVPREDNTAADALANLALDR